jgi:hypothetical protein
MFSDAMKGNKHYVETQKKKQKNSTLEDLNF